MRSWTRESLKALTVGRWLGVQPVKATGTGIAAVRTLREQAEYQAQLVLAAAEAACAAMHQRGWAICLRSRRCSAS